MSSKKSKTGANLEPMPFIRKFGSNEDGDEGTQKIEEWEEAEVKYKKSKHSKRENRSRSRSHEEKKRKKKRSRSRSRSRDRDREERRRDRKNRDSSRSRGHDSHDRLNESSEENPGTNSAAIDPMAAAIAAATLAAQRIRSNQGPVGSQAFQQLSNENQRGSTISDSLLADSKPLIKSELDDWLPGETAEQRRDRRRKSRWSTTKSFIPGMPTILPSNIDDTQRQCYLLTMEIEEATRHLRAGDFLAPDSERSPSPEPIYDANGKRLNTREVRKKQELEQRRHEKIQQLLKINSEYKPPADYRPPNIRFNDKVWIPQDEVCANPTINFVGLLIGPRGNTLKALEAETGAKIIIRGKGSVKEGKLGLRQGPLPGENEPLHAYITSTDREAVKRGCDKVREIINAALMIPDGQNELRKLQLRELAILNGTLRPEDLLSGARCSNCGSDQHKTWECMEAPNVTAQVMCAACGGYGHVTKDCKNPRPGFQFDGAGIDAEYSALMAELGEKPAGGFPGNAGGFTGQPRVPFGFQQHRPRFVMPSGTPIVRVNLAQQMSQQRGPPGGYGGYFPTPTDPQSYAAAAAAWAAYMAATGGYPSPVPPPPSSSESGADSSSGGAGLAGLAFAPPPPPPPPPVPKTEQE